MEYKFKIGDKVEIATKSDMSNYPVGSVGVIEDNDPSPEIAPLCYCVNLSGFVQWIEEDNLKLIEND
jgi:hypothetical protein